MEIKKQPVSIHVPQVLEGSAASSNRVLPQGSQRNAAGVAEGERPKSFGNSLMPMASASYSQPDLSGNAGFASMLNFSKYWYLSVTFQILCHFLLSSMVTWLLGFYSWLLGFYVSSARELEVGCLCWSLWTRDTMHMHVVAKG